MTRYQIRMYKTRTETDYEIIIDTENFDKFVKELENHFQSGSCYLKDTSHLWRIQIVNFVECGG